jgi:hypothetical protein
LCVQKKSFNFFLNIPETFHLNPRLSLTLSESDEVILALNQHTAMDPKVIGFTGYQVPVSDQTRLLKEMVSLFFMKISFHIYLKP